MLKSNQIIEEKSESFFKISYALLDMKIFYPQTI